MPQYTCDAATAEWRHVHQRKPPRNWLGQVSYEGGAMAWNPSAGSPSPLKPDELTADAAATRFESALAEARAVAKVASSEHKRNTGALLSGQQLSELLSPEGAPLRWFLLPAEANLLHKGLAPQVRASFTPDRFRAQAGRADAAQGAPAEPAVPNGHAAPAPAPKKAPKAAAGGGGGDGWMEPPKKLANKVMRAVLQHGMLRPGDRVLVGLSGGKDSLCMLHVLHALQKRTPFKWDLAACTVDPQADGFDPSPLIPYCARLGVPYFYERQALLAMADTCMAKEGNRVSICSFCSRMKRGVLYATARREGYNVLAMAQHLDDLAESFVMSAFQNGALRSMKAHYLIDAEDLRVIRPLAYVRETEAESFAEGAKLPIIPETCPACFEAPKERYRIKCLLATQEALFPSLFHSLLRTILPLTEPQVEDVLRLRREAYGRVNGPPHVPPPLHITLGEEHEEAARRAQLPGEKHDARVAWQAALKLSRQRINSGGRGQSIKGRAAAAADEEEDVDLAGSWFGGKLDAEGNFVPQSGAGRPHAHRTSTKKKKKSQDEGAAGGNGSAVQAAQGQAKEDLEEVEGAAPPAANTSWWVEYTSALMEPSSRKIGAIAAGWAAAAILVASVGRKR